MEEYKTADFLCHGHSSLKQTIADKSSLKHFLALFHFRHLKAFRPKIQPCTDREFFVFIRPQAKPVGVVPNTFNKFRFLSPSWPLKRINRLSCLSYFQNMSATLKPQINHDMDFVYQHWDLQLVCAIVKCCAGNRSCGCPCPWGKKPEETHHLDAFFVLFFLNKWCEIKGVTIYWDKIICIEESKKKKITEVYREGFGE